MNHLVLLTASPRANGNSNILADAFINGASEEGVKVTRYDLARLHVHPCLACNQCYQSGKACIQNDDFNEIAEAILNTDGLVLAAPVYWYTFPAQLKACLDRFYSFVIGERSLKGKKTALLTCCEENSSDTFDGLLFSYNKTIELLGMESAGVVRVPNVLNPGDIHNTDGERLAASLIKLFI